MPATSFNSPTRFALLLDGVYAGSLKSISDLDYPTSLKPGTRSDQLGKMEQRALAPTPVLECGAGMTQAFYSWVQTSCNKGCAGKSCAIIALDYAGKELYRDTLSLALITEVAFPACDAGSKDPGVMTLTLSASYSTRENGGSMPCGVLAPAKAWMSSNFRLTIDGLESACKSVSKVEPITFQRGQPPSVLQFTVAAAGVSAVKDWLKLGKPTRGTLDYLAPDLKSTLFTVSFESLLANDAGRLALKSVQLPTTNVVTLKCGRVTLAATPT